jgi:hypothetical protein
VSKTKYWIIVILATIISFASENIAENYGVSRPVGNLVYFAVFFAISLPTLLYGSWQKRKRRRDNKV